MKLTRFYTDVLRLLARKSLLPFALCLSINVSAKEGSLSSQISPDKLGICIATLINKAGGPGYLQNQQRTARQTRQRISSNSEIIKEFSNHGFPSNRFEIENALAAIPLIDPKKFTDDTSTRVPLAYILFSQYCSHYGTEIPCPIPPVERLDLENVVKIISESSAGLKRTATSDQLSEKINQSEVLADPIVKWLLTKKARSGEHYLFSRRDA